jgi:WD40 repeat protein
MSTTTTTPPTDLVKHVTPLEGGGHVLKAAWLGSAPALAAAEGTVLIGPPGAQRRVMVHEGAGLLVAAAAGDRLVTGGADGRVAVVSPDGTAREVARDPRGGWIDAVAVHSDGAIAFSVGKAVTAIDARGQARSLQSPSTPQGLAFAPKGYRLAVAHYGGASLWYPNTETPAQVLDWKGAHLDVIISPDGRFVVTSMQENALHGWRLPASPTEKVAHMRMSGYPSKTRAFSWSHDGLWLATSGADAVIIWPFQGEGPMGKAPRECGVRRARVTQVAFHPGAYVIAAGYSDGGLLLIRMTDGSELVARPATRDSEITALAWEKGGKRLLFGAADGAAGVLSLPG